MQVECIIIGLSVIKKKKIPYEYVKNVDTSTLIFFIDF